MVGDERTTTNDLRYRQLSRSWFRRIRGSRGPDWRRNRTPWNRRCLSICRRSETAGGRTSRPENTRSLSEKCIRIIKIICFENLSNKKHQQDFVIILKWLEQPSKTFILRLLKSTICFILCQTIQSQMSFKWIMFFLRNLWGSEINLMKHLELMGNSFTKWIFLYLQMFIIQTFLYLHIFIFQIFFYLHIYITNNSICKSKFIDMDKTG